MSRWVRSLIVGVVALSAFFRLATQAAPATPWDSQVLVQLQPPPHATEALDQFTGAVDGRNLVPLAGVPDTFVVETDSLAARNALIQTLRNLSVVRHAQPNHTYRHAVFTPNDPLYNRQWNFDAVGASTAWDADTTVPLYGGDPSVVVAVLDSGFSVGPDYASTNLTPGYDYVNDDSNTSDDNGHGTHVTGTIAESTNNGIGVAGLAFATTIMPIKVLDASGTGTTAGITAGVNFARLNGADVLNLSLGGPDDDPILHAAITQARNAGLIIVAATGNDGISAISYPARYDEVISVTSVRYDQTRPAYANYGTGLDLAAPGGDSTVDQNSDGLVDGVLQQTCTSSACSAFNNFLYVGTSQAAPHVSATVALMLAAGATPETITTILYGTAKDLGTAGYDTTYGNGLVQTGSAVQQAVTDTLGPTGTLSINAGATATASTAVSLTLTAQDASPVTAMQFSNDGVTYTSAEAFAGTKSWNLADTAVGGSSADGVHTVYLKLTDSHSNVSSVISDAIILDTVTPSALTIQGFQTTARQRPLASGEATAVSRPSFRFSASDAGGVKGYHVVWSASASVEPTSGNFQTGATFTPPSVTRPGVRYLRVRVEDEAGNRSGIKTFLFRRRASSVVTAATGSNVSTLDGARGNIVRTFGMAAFQNQALSLAHGDLDRNGRDEIIVTSRSTGSTVMVLNASGSRVRQFRVYSRGFTGGLSVAVGDIDGDRSPEIVTVPARGAAQVTIFSSTGKKQRQFFALPTSYRGGATVALADITGDEVAEILVGTSSRTSRVLTFNGAGTQLKNLTPFGSSSRTGLVVAATDTDANGRAEIAVAERRAGCKLKLLNDSGTQLRVVTPFSRAVTNCTLVSTDLDSNGRDEVVIIPPTGQAKLLDRTTSTRWRLRTTQLPLRAAATFYLR